KPVKSSFPTWAGSGTRFPSLRETAAALSKKTAIDVPRRGLPRQVLPERTGLAPGAENHPGRRLVDFLGLVHRGSLLRVPPLLAAGRSQRQTIPTTVAQVPVPCGQRTLD